MFRNAPLAAAALLGLALTATPALAAEKTSVKVSFADLDLTTIEGQDRLDRRLDSAARKACGYDRQFTGSLRMTAQSKTCYKQARSKSQALMASAVENAGSRLGG